MDDSDSSGNLTSTFKHQRTIIHIDVDCFYAQVEMLKNPALTQLPLGVQQKNIVVTSNYIARESGIEKCMSVSDAMKMCPELVLVSGEDLYDYRQMSTKITHLLQSFSPHVEKLGLDENFIDVSDLVRKRLGDRSINQVLNVKGHTYDDDADLQDCPCGCHLNLTLGSQIAQEMRTKIFEELHITTCAGVGYNKLLAKLVGPTHKPNQQTTLFPCKVSALLHSLKSVRSIPGIGHCMHGFLQSINISSIADLQNMDMEGLQKGIGIDTALRIKKLSFGIDDTVVKQSGKPQTIGLEDGFQKIGLECDVKDKFAVLLQRLMTLLAEDGRIPGSVKITVRKYDNVAKHSHRESRQCNISHSLFSPGFDNQLKPAAIQKVMSLIMQLFHKIVDIRKPFHLTLLGVAFTKFQERSTGKSSITSFLQQDLSVQSVMDLKNCVTLESPPMSISASRNSNSRFSTDKSGSESDLEPSPKKTRKNLWVNTTRKRLADEMDQDCDSPSKLKVSDLRLTSPGQSRESRGNCSKQEQLTKTTGCNRVESLQCPSNVDESVFRQLPLEMQKELEVEWGMKEKISNKSKLVGDSKQNTILKYFVHNNNLS